MSWHQGKIFDKTDLTQGTTVELPSTFQVGQEVRLWMFDDMYVPLSVAAVVVAVNIGRHHAVSYDLAFQIGTTELYAVVKDFRGYVTDKNATSIDYTGGLVDVEEIKEVLVSGTPDPSAPGATKHLVLVKSKK